MLFSANISIWIALHGNCSAGTTARDVSLRDTRGAERERNKNMERRNREGREGYRERERERERERRGDVRIEKIIIGCGRETNWEIKTAYIGEEDESNRETHLTGRRWCWSSKWRKTMNKWQRKEVDRFGVRGKWGGGVEMEGEKTQRMSKWGRKVRK